MPSDGAYDPTVHLSYGDVRADSLVNLTCITVAIKASMMDPFQKGGTAHVGVTKSQLCPLAALLAYMVQRGPQAGPFFLFKDGRSPFNTGPPGSRSQESSGKGRGGLLSLLWS